MSIMWKILSPEDLTPTDDADIDTTLLYLWSDESLPVEELTLKFQQFLEVIMHRFNYRLLPLLDTIFPGNFLVK